MPTRSNQPNEQEVTAKKILYILETRKTIPSDWTSTQINKMHAAMIVEHIHNNFVLKEKP